MVIAKISNIYIQQYDQLINDRAISRSIIYLGFVSVIRIAQQ